MEGELDRVRAVKRLLLGTPVRDGDTSWTLGVVWISRDVDDSREEEGTSLVAQWLRTVSYTHLTLPTSLRV